MENNHEAIDKILAVLEISLNKDELELPGKLKIKIMLKKWINAADSLIEMFILKLLSPVKA